MRQSAKYAAVAYSRFSDMPSLCVMHHLYHYCLCVMCYCRVTVSDECVLSCIELLFITLCVYLSDPARDECVLSCIELLFITLCVYVLDPARDECVLSCIELLFITLCVYLSDPARDECFGGVFSQFLLDELLGYDNIILYSLKQLAHDKPDKGSTNSIGVARGGCSGCTCTPRVEKKIFSGLIYRKMCKCTP